MPNLTVAVIDLGSNSFRMQVSVVKDNIYKVVEEYKETTRVADSVYRTGGFTDECNDVIIGTLKRMQRMLSKYEISKYRIVGTAPFRDASNAKETIELVKREVGEDIEVISGEEEARLVYLAATSYFDLSGQNALFVDIGGGSTELSYAENNELLEYVSTPLGCSRLTYEFFSKDRAKPEEVVRIKEFIDRSLLNAISPNDISRTVFTGGTVNAIAEVYARRNKQSDSIVKYVDTTFLNHFVSELSGKKYEDRKKIQGLDAERADISLAAALVVQKLLREYHQQGFFTFSGGLRNGVTIDMLNKMGIEMLFQTLDSDTKYTRLVETGRKYNFEEDHALHVTMLSKKLFGDLHKPLGLKKEAWQLLEAAGILHDIGQYISYSGHHKHSEYLIENSDLVWFSDAEKKLIALISRFHRRKMPSSKHSKFHSLSSDNQQLVSKLAAILRVADGLDRSHLGVVKDLNVTVTDDEVCIHIQNTEDVDMEIDGFNKKKDLLEKLLGKNVNIYTGN